MPQYTLNNLVHTKGQLISKGIFGVFSSPQKTVRKQVDLMYHSTVGNFFENSGYQQVLLKIN